MVMSLKVATQSFWFCAFADCHLLVLHGLHPLIQSHVDEVVDGALVLGNPVVCILLALEVADELCAQFAGAVECFPDIQCEHCWLYSAARLHG
jgi:hypothetical protein